MKPVDALFEWPQPLLWTLLSCPICGNPRSSDSLRWQIHPNAIFRLGEELITDHVQALVELIKNSYDADSDYALVEILTNARVGERFPDSFFPGHIGFVFVIDEGEGMTREQIRQGWLTVANSRKGAPGRKQKTSRNRTPMGDKGLGRLGSQLLGDCVEIWTNPKGGTEQHHFGIDWTSFRTATKLQNVKVFEETTQRPEGVPHGTTIVISTVADGLAWVPEVAERLTYKLSELVSPFEKFDGFEVDVVVDGQPYDVFEFSRLEGLADKAFSFSLSNDGWQLEDPDWPNEAGTLEGVESLFVSGKIRLRALRPGPKRVELFKDEIALDGGDRMTRALLHRLSSNRAWEIVRSGGSRWLLAFRSSKPLEQISARGFETEPVFQKMDASVQPTMPGKGAPSKRRRRISPGPFSGLLYGFDRSLEDEALSSQGFEMSKRYRASETKKKATIVNEYRTILEEMWGVYVYRDGFGVRTARDFLDLGDQTTSGRSFYGLRPASTIGYVAISSELNPLLQELTNREGFRSSPAHTNFTVILDEVKDWTAKILEALRRETLLYLDDVLAERAQLDPEQGVDELARSVRKSIATAPRIRQSLRSAQTNAEAAVLNALNALPDPSHLRLRMDGLLQKVREVEGKLSEPLEQFALLADRFEFFQRRHEALRERMREASDSYGLALVAEVVAHDLDETTRRFDDEFQRLKSFLKRKPRAEPFLGDWGRRLKSLNRSLQKQVSHLNPALRYRRLRKESIDLQKFFKQIQEYCEMRWAGSSLRMQFDNDGPSPASVRVSRGRLLMIFDNMIINNAEAWLKRALELGHIDEGVVFVRLDHPHLEIWDNGLGIDPLVEETLFDPYVTTKTGGRGIGLYIAQQILEDEGCSIRLLRRRNEHGRRYIFQVSLAGMVEG